jgi:hypothetical protein
MKGPAKIIVLAIAAVVLMGGAFWGGMAYQDAKGPVGSVAGADAGGRMGGGPMADLTEEEQAELESMTAEERQAWLQENMGEVGRGGPMRGGTLEGEVIEVADDTITLTVNDTGSQTVYTDADTTVAYVEGAPALAAGSQVMIIAEPSTDGVTTASLVVVTR